MRKKLVTVLTTTSMLTGMLSSAAFAGGALEVADNPDDWPVVTVQTPAINMSPDEEMIEEALNEYLVSIDAGVKIDMTQITLGDMSTTLTLMLSDNKEPLDVFCWRFYSTVDGCVKNEQCIPLDDYMEVYPDLWESYPDKVLQTQQIDGVQYAVPSVDSYGTYEVYALREDIAEELGIADRDGERITMDEMEQIMMDAKALHPEYAYMINTDDAPVIGIDNFGNGDWLGVLMNRGVGTTEVVNLYETQEWEDFCHRMKRWNENGLLCDDPLNNTMNIDQWHNGVAAGCYLGGYSKDYIKALMAYSPYKPVQFQLTDLVGNSASVLGGWMISSACKNPDAAMKALYLMATDETVARMFILGLEGVHYTVDENGIARRPEGVTGQTATWNQDCPWYYPNQCLSIPLETDMTTYYTDMLEAPNNAEYSDAMGFVFDSSEVFDEMAACSTVVAEYRPALLYGLVDVDTYLDKFIEELKDAGIDKIIEEEQRQLDEWLAEE